MTEERRVISIRSLLLLLFLMLIVISYALTGTLIFRKWIASTNTLIEQVNTQIGDDIATRIDAFLQIPLNTNQVGKIIIENQLINPADETVREKLFVEILRQQPDDIYSIGFGTETGEYYGARRNPKQQIEIMRNNAETGGNSWYYSVSEENTADRMVLDAGLFDARTRDWYKAARHSGEPVFSPLYMHFILQDLTISAAQPVCSPEGKLLGVLGIHTTLSRVSNQLRAIAADKNAQILVVEAGTAFLIADTMGLDPFRELPDGTFEQNTIDTAKLPALSRLYESYQANKNNAGRIRMNGGWYNVHITPYSNSGLDWLIFSMIPEKSYTTVISVSLLVSVGIIVILLVVVTLLYRQFTARLLGRLDRLVFSAEQFADGDHARRLDIERNDEFGKLVQAFNHMADSVSMMLDHPEDIDSSRE